MIEAQEQTLRYETSIQKAWIIIALSDYQDFVTVYDYINNFDKENVKVRELYNNESYILDNRPSLEKIK